MLVATSRSVAACSQRSVSHEEKLRTRFGRLGCLPAFFSSPAVCHGISGTIDQGLSACPADAKLRGMTQIATAYSAADHEGHRPDPLENNDHHRGIQFVQRPPEQACRLCSLGRDDISWNTVLWETVHFRVVPSKGGFVPGWLMIVPKAHVLSTAALADDQCDEFVELISFVGTQIARRFGNPTVFEHGAVAEKSSFGCGIDHAHVHLVPLPNGSRLRSLAEEVLGEEFKPQTTAPKNAYLRVRAPDDEKFYIIEPRSAPPRQFFRQLIWQLGQWQASTYDYDGDSCEAIVRTTLGALEGT
jgi:diadenosine tetraphosphate (Ap4A) HIT family hydrolase